MNTAHEIWLPAIFWNDHDERALPAGEFLHYSGRRVLIRATDAVLDEIRSDADYYSGPGGPDWEEGDSIRRSAAATVKAIDRYRARVAELAAIKARAVDHDPTPWCHICGAMKKDQCQCPPRAEND